MKTFLNDYKVLIIGGLSAILLALNEVFKTGSPDGKALAFAAFLALLSYLANNLRGQWASIAGILGTALTNYLTEQQTGTVSWPQIILQMLGALLAVLASPAKSRGYEHAPTIVTAKVEGEEIASTPIASTVQKEARQARSKR